jgi:GxxExxY protein
MHPDTNKTGKISRDPETYAILGAAMEVHRLLGHGFLEAVYHDALAIELTARSIPFQREVPLGIHYKNELLRSSCRADLVCYQNVLVELKALSELTSRESAIAINYLKATGFERCLLINFGSPRLEYKRFIRSGGSPISSDD